MQETKDLITDRVRSYWDWRSHVYDTTCSRHRQWHEVFLAPFGEHGRRLDILDLGSGTGFMALGFARLGHRVTGVDISPEMVGFSRARAREEHLDVTFMQGDVAVLPSFDRLFDGVTCRNLLWTLPDPLCALARWKTALKPGGTVVIADGLWEPRLYLQNGGEVVERFSEAYGEICRGLPFFPGISAEDGRTLLIEAGYEDVERHDHLFTENPYTERHDFFVLSAKKTLS